MKTPTILATVLNVAATCRHLRRGMSHNKWILSAAAAIAVAFALPAAAAAPAHAQVCSLGTCAGFVTVHDSDGNGPAPAKTRHHENLVANLTYYLDTDGDLPAAQATVLGDYELRVKIEGLSADKPKVTIAKLKADEALPLKIEVVKANSNGTFKGLGYDARTSWTGKVSSAPRLFVADIDTSNRDGDATTDQSRVTATIEGAPADLMLVNESFRPPYSHGHAVLIEVDLTVKATGKRLRDEEIHLWEFGPDGKVVSLRHFLDTAKAIDAHS